MRVKGYNEFITEVKKHDDKFGITPELESDVKDIFVELLDDGIEVDTQCWKDYSDTISITLSPIQDWDKDSFEIVSVKEYVMMLIDYMNMKYDVKKVSYDVALGDFDSNDFMFYSYDSFPDNVADLYTDEFCINFKLSDVISETFINEGFGDFTESDYDKIESDVNDMFIDLKDDGAKIDVDFYHKGVGYGTGPDDYMIKVQVYSGSDFKVIDLEEPIRMMVDYFQDLTGNKVDMEYQRSRDYTNTRQREFSPYSFDDNVSIFLIERG